MGYGLAHGHAHFKAHHLSQAVGVLPHQVGGAEQDLFAQLVVVQPVSRVAVEGSAGGIDTSPGVLQGALGSDGSHLPGVGRILALELTAAGGRSLLSID